MSTAELRSSAETPLFDPATVSQSSSLLVPFAGLIFAYYVLGFAGLSFKEPVMLWGDHVSGLLAMIKNSMNGVDAFNENLAAPKNLNLFQFPLFDGSYKALIWIFTRFTSNVFLVASLFYATGVGLMFAASFWSFRILGIGPILASVASIAFIVCPYFASRSYAHDCLVLYYSVPMGAALALWLSDGNALKKVATPFSICAILLLGTSGFYYAFFGAMFLGLSMTGASIAQRSLTPLLVCAGIAAALIFLLLFSAYNIHMIGLLDGSIVSPPRRGASEQFYHGLGLWNVLKAYSSIEFFANRFTAYRLSIPPDMQNGEGMYPEWPSAFLSTVIIASPIALFPLIQARSKRYRIVALCIAFITFGLLFATRFGLGSLFTFLITPAVRGQARIMPFLMFFAIAASCLACTIIEHRKASAVACMALGLILLAGTYPAYKIIERKQTAYLASPEERANRESLNNIIAAKDSANLTTVFQLPVMAWPEVPPIEGLKAADPILPYIFDKIGSKTRWSYGLNLDEIKPYEAIASTPTDIVSKMRPLGFDSILVEKRGYQPEHSAQVIDALKATGACIVHDDALRTLFVICK